MYQRIIILGGNGSGKSTLANRIGQYTGYPVYHLDNLLLDSNWIVKDKSEWEKICQQFLSTDVGIVDGNYTTSWINRLNWADLVIFIDIPTRVQLWRIITRYFRNKLGLDKRYGFPEGSKEKLSWKFVSWVYHWNSKHKNKIFDMLESYKDKKILIIKEPKKLDLKSIFN